MTPPEPLSGKSGVNINIANPESPQFDPGSPDFDAAAVMWNSLRGGIGVIGDVQTVTPTEGQTIQMTNNGRNGLLKLLVPTPLESVTILFPDEPTAKLLQLRRIYCSGSIGSVDLRGEDGVVVDSNISSYDPKDFFSFSRIAPAHWARQTS